MADDKDKPKNEDYACGRFGYLRLVRIPGPSGSPRPRSRVSRSPVSPSVRRDGGVLTTRTLVAAARRTDEAGYRRIKDTRLIRSKNCGKPSSFNTHSLPIIVFIGASSAP